MSRRPKPTALKELTGNAGHRPLPKNEWKPESGAPEMPRALRKAARRAWAHWCEVLLGNGVLTIADGPALAMACDAFADWEEAQKDIVKHGQILIAPVLDRNSEPILYNGRPLVKHTANPACAIKNAAMKTMKSFLIEFGLTPASRPRIHSEKPAPVDALEEALNWMPDTDANPMPPSLDNN
jgi:P27 family predicted phage terminase small subunit